jgi:hypothetical protein
VIELPFNTLILTCLHRGTSYSEKGIDVKIEPRTDEMVLFFIIDDQSNPKSKLRQNLEIEGSICDLLVYCAFRNSDEKIICLVELKGNDIDKAVRQIINTYESFKKRYSDLQNLKQQLKPITWKAYIRLGGSAPIRIKDQNRASLKSALNNNKNFKFSRENDIGNFLRGIDKL